MELMVAATFFSSGSTLIATEKDGRRCYGVEIDAIYVDLVVRRYEEVPAKGSLLEQSDQMATEGLCRYSFEGLRRLWCASMIGGLRCL